MGHNEAGELRFVTKVLFVCLGNICRSPAAQGVFEQILSKQGRSGDFLVDSAGTSSFHTGALADARMREKALQRGFELISRSRQVTNQDFESFDYIVAMDDSNYFNLLNLANNPQAQVVKMVDYLSANFSDFNEIPDPYYGETQGFNLVLDLLEDACLGLYQSITSSQT